jgi:hypothetical protein
MSESIQHWVVYIIVGLATFQLTRPIWEYLYKKIKYRNMPQKQSESYAFYQSSCSSCSIRK